MNPYFLIMLGVMAAAVTLEAAVSAWRGRHLFRWRDTLTNLTMYVGYVAVLLVWVEATYFIYDWVHGHALFDLTSEGPLARRYGPAAPWVLLVVLEDLCFYVFHRSSHRSGFLWAAHQAHHSSRYFNLSTAFRQSWAPFLTTPFWLPLPLLGFAPEAVLWVQSISLSFQFFLHTELVPSFGPLDLIFNSPRHHRAHHGREEAFWDRNFGGVSILWDRLFGSFTSEQPQTYGLADSEPQGPLSAELGPWVELSRHLARSRTPGAALKALFGPPGQALPSPPPESFASKELSP